MNNFEDIQKLWQQHTVAPQQDAAELTKLIKQKRRREGVQMLCGTLGLAITFFFILFIGYHYPFAYLSTYAGISLVLLSVVAAVVLNSRMLSLLYQSAPKEDTDNTTLLAHMKEYQQRQRFFQTRFISAYYITLSIGLVLYMFEITHRSPLFMAIAYAVTLGWVAFAWWYIRPRTIRKQTTRIQTIIDHLEDLEGELREE